jgi:hypothetical protein
VELQKEKQKIKKAAAPKKKCDPKVTAFRKNVIQNTVSAPINWPREMKLTAKLLEIVNDMDFWNHCKLSFPIPSLAWFLTPNGKAYVNKEYRVFKTALNLHTNDSQNHTHPIGESKIGEDFAPIANKKPKSLADFLKSS